MNKKVCPFAISFKLDTVVGAQTTVIRFCTKEMKAIALCAVTGALLATAMGVAASAEPPAALTVRLYNASGIAAPELVAARHAIDATFEDTGLDLIVRHCGPPLSPGGQPDLCGERLKPFEVVVRIIEAPTFSASLDPEACGMAYVVKETDRGWLATAFSDRIANAASRVGVDAGTLLGLVIAHEVGHLMLGGRYHSWQGVMRADWPEALLERKSDQWRFSKLEGAMMRQVASIRF